MQRADIILLFNYIQNVDSLPFPMCWIFWVETHAFKTMELKSYY